MAKSIKELFDSIKNRNDETHRLDEEYRVGEAAKALHDTIKAVKNLEQFLSKDFAAIYKKMHMDPRSIEDTAYEIIEQLDSQQEILSNQINLLKDYIGDINTYVNPESVNKDTHRQDYKRWQRWDRREDE